MAWLRIDDGFTANTKIAQLTDAEFRVWMRLLCHCAGSRDPSVDAVARREVSGLTARRVERFRQLDLVDKVGDDFEVHGWSDFLPKDATNAERQKRWRARHRNAQSNADRNVTSGDVAVTENVTPSRARDAGAGTRGVPSRPVPSQEPFLHPSVPSNPAKNGRTDGDPERITPTDAEPILEQARPT